MARYTASRLRENIYKILDQVLDSGTPVEIERGGKKLLIVPESPPDKFSKLRRRKALRGLPGSIVSTDWSKTWKWKG